MTHPDHAAQARHFGTIAGLRVEAMALDCADHPERPKSPVAVNGIHTWVKVGAAPWVPTVLDDHHYRVALPAAIKVAVTRYAAQAVGEMR